MKCVDTVNQVPDMAGRIRVSVLVITRNLYMLALIVTDLLGYFVCVGGGYVMLI